MWGAQAGFPYSPTYGIRKQQSDADLLSSKPSFLKAIRSKHMRRNWSSYGNGPSATRILKPNDENIVLFRSANASRPCRPKAPSTKKSSPRPSSAVVRARQHRDSQGNVFSDSRRPCYTSVHPSAAAVSRVPLFEAHRLKVHGLELSGLSKNNGINITRILNEIELPQYRKAFSQLKQSELPTLCMRHLPYMGITDFSHQRKIMKAIKDSIKASSFPAHSAPKLPPLSGISGNLAAIDTTGDGKVDSIGVDSTGDGKANSVVKAKGVDTDGDGRIDTACASSTRVKDSYTSKVPIVLGPSHNSCRC